MSSSSYRKTFLLVFTSFFTSMVKRIENKLHKQNQNLILIKSVLSVVRDSYSQSVSTGEIREIKYIIVDILYMCVPDLYIQDSELLF